MVLRATLIGMVSIFLLHAPLEAQRSGGGGHFALGSVRLDMDALNGLFAANGLPSVESSAISFGGGGYAVNGRLVLGGEGHGFLLGDETTTDGQTGLRVGGGYGVAILGMELNQGGKHRIQPRVGLGVGGYSVQIGQREVPRLEDVLSDPGRGVNLSHGGLVRTLGVRIERTFRGPGGSGPVLGLEFGGVAGMGSWSWTSEWGDVTRGPNLPFEGSYIRGTFGGGGRRTR
jgi:hypothetical protein